MIAKIDHIKCWIFDLDLTLYGPEHRIMDQVRDRIAHYVEQFFKCSPEKSHEIRHDYWRKYGTTLGGLMSEHGVDPHGYLDFVHDVDLSLLQPCPVLIEAIAALPGRKLIFTNADAPYAQRVLERRGLGQHFEDIFDIHRMDHTPKPHPDSYTAMCKAMDMDAATALFVEDSAHNLEPAKTLGMTTVWINHATEGHGPTSTPDYVDHEITDLAAWLVATQEQMCA